MDELPALMITNVRSSPGGVFPTPRLSLGYGRSTEAISLNGAALPTVASGATADGETNHDPRH